MAHLNHDTIGPSAGQLLVQVCRAHRNKAQELLIRVDLHPGQEFLLYHLWSGDGLTQSELAECLGVQPSTLTRMLDRMEKAALVERQPDLNDQRISRVYLTAAGRALEAPVCDIWGDLETVMVAGLSPAEVDELRGLLARVLTSLS
jgi:DNA-binding MarR family transcriptional regulator